MKITPEQYERAAKAVRDAVIQKTGRRLHIDRYKKDAAQVLGIKAVYPGRWREVIEAGERLGYFKVDRTTLRHPFFEVAGHRNWWSCQGEQEDEPNPPASIMETLTESAPPTFIDDVEEPDQTGSHMVVLARYPKGHHRSLACPGWHIVGDAVAASSAKAQERLQRVRMVFEGKGARTCIARFDPSK